MAPKENLVKLGVIGLSEGNGHPYSWSAIFNGFDYDEMKNCNFPVIPEYLSRQKFPDDFLTKLGKVEAIWTQNIDLSKHIAISSKIPYVCDDIKELSVYADAILLARDDSENHKKMSDYFLSLGMPIFIDKPFSLSIKDANEIFNNQMFDNQIFTCSSLRYSEELLLSRQEKEELGEIIKIEAFCPKYWDTYAVHLIEPIIVNCNFRGELRNVKKISSSPWHSTLIEWENLKALIHMTQKEPHPLEILFIGKNKSIKRQFSDSFSCFKKSLNAFVNQINTKELQIERRETLEIVKILEYGR